MNGQGLRVNRERSNNSQHAKVLRWLGAGAICVSSMSVLVAPAHSDNDSAEQSVNAGVNDTEDAPGLDPAKLIESMSKALRTLTYEGVFVHAQGSNLTSMHVLHTSNRHGVFERLSALDGEAREVIRNNSLVTCIWPDSKSVVVSEAKPRKLLARVDSSLASNPGYRFTLGSPDRVAGRSTHVVNVVPRDEYRYGYRFWIDTDTSMLLRSMLLESANFPIEQIFFTQIDYPDSVDLSRFDIIYPGERGELVSWLEPKKAQAISDLEKQASDHSNIISFMSLPDGYAKVSETSSISSDSEGPMIHVMISDGMASVSIYAEYINPAESAVTMGLSRMGAMNAYTLVSNGGVLITAVGEVPEATVRSIAAAVVLNE